MWTADIVRILQHEVQSIYAWGMTGLALGDQFPPVFKRLVFKEDNPQNIGRGITPMGDVGEG